MNNTHREVEMFGMTEEEVKEDFEFSLERIGFEDDSKVNKIAMLAQSMLSDAQFQIQEFKDERGSNQTINRVKLLLATLTEDRPCLQGRI